MGSRIHPVVHISLPRPYFGSEQEKHFQPLPSQEDLDEEPPTDTIYDEENLPTTITPTYKATICLQLRIQTKGKTKTRSGTQWKLLSVLPTHKWKKRVKNSFYQKNMTSCKIDLFHFLFLF